MYAFSDVTISGLYAQVVPAVWEQGEAIAPRGLETRELLHCGMTLRDPRARLLTLPGRNINPFFHLAEALWIVGARSDSEWLCNFNGRLAQVLDTDVLGDPSHFHAPYGERLRRWGWNRQRTAHLPPYRDQLVDCYEVLRKDPASRQALMVLWNPDWDNPDVVTRDRPCNTTVAFKLRNGALHMSVFNRSNDLVFGWSTTNVLQFTTLQEVLASWLGATLGEYTHYADSLHIYAEDAFGGYVSPPTLAGIHTEVGGDRPWYTYTPVLPVYGYVRPSAMFPTTPATTDATVETLLARIPDHVTLNAERDAASWGTRDPFWLTVGHALRAHTLYKRGLDPETVYSALAWIPGADWKIECLRWMYDRYDARQVETGREACDVLETIPLLRQPLVPRRWSADQELQCYVCGRIPL